MKTIQPVTSWVNGQAVQAKVLNAYAINDNLSTSAQFYYALLDENLTKVAEGNLSMTGEAYTQYETNNYAWDWIATTLGLTITGDYVPPAPVVTETPTEPVPSEPTPTI